MTARGLCIAIRFYDRAVSVSLLTKKGGNSMSLISDKEREQLAKDLRGSIRSCSSCELEGDLEVQQVVGIPTLERGLPSGLQQGDGFFPVVPVVCSSCGRTEFFSAMKYLYLD